MSQSNLLWKKNNKESVLGLILTPVAVQPSVEKKPEMDTTVVWQDSMSQSNLLWKKNLVVLFLLMLASRVAVQPSVEKKRT